MRPLLFALLAIAAAPAVAQVNRCQTPAGVVYQQDPCPGGKVVVAAPQPAAPLPPDGPGRDLCIAAAPGFFKDPDSVRIGLVTRGPNRPLTTRRGEISAPTYIMYVNAKNAFGGYTGEKLHRCYVSQDEREVYTLE